MLVMFTTREHSVFAVNAVQLSAARIAEALRMGAARATGGAVAWGAWLGPAPRVTRRQELNGQYVYVTWVWEFPDDTWAQAHGGYVLEALKRDLTGPTGTLKALSADFEPVMTSTYAEAVNGTRAWWSSGNASVTRTMNEPPLLVGTDAAENPVGPTTDATHPTGLTQPGGGLDAMKPLLYLAGAALGVYVVATVVAPLVKLYTASAGDSGERHPPRPRPLPQTREAPRLNPARKKRTR